MNGIHVLARGCNWSPDIELLIRQFSGQGGRVVSEAEPLVFKEVLEADMGMPVSPTLRMGRDQAQQLMDALWQCGLRPSEGTGSAGALAATQKHLEDMRTIALLPYRTQLFVESKGPLG